MFVLYETFVLRRGIELLNKSVYTGKKYLLGSICTSNFFLRNNFFKEMMTKAPFLFEFLFTVTSTIFMTMIKHILEIYGQGLLGLLVWIPEIYSIKY